MVISGGVVSSKYFLESFGLLNSDGTTDTSKSNAVSSNVVSVLQAGAFFGALGSSPISGVMHFIHFQHRQLFTFHSENWEEMDTSDIHYYLLHRSGK